MRKDYGSSADIVRTKCGATAVPLRMLCRSAILVHRTKHHEPHSETMSSTASEAFRKCSAHLIKAIQDQDLLVLAWEPFSVGITLKPVLEGLSAVGLSPVEKKTRLLSAVGDQIDVDPAKFYKFL